MTATTDAARLAEIRERVEKATKGPWRLLHDFEGAKNPACDCAQVWTGSNDSWPVAFCDTQHEGEGYTRAQQMTNATFIAHARADIPWLLARIEELERTRAESDAVVAVIFHAAGGDEQAVLRKHKKLNAAIARHKAKEPNNG